VDRHTRQNGQGISDAVGAVKLAVVIVVPLLCMLGVLGGIGSFATVRRLAAPWFGDWAWIVPVGVDTGILALLAWDLLAEYLGLSWPVMRWTAWAFITATVYLNVAAAHGSLTASVMHAAMPVLFVTVIEGIRHLIRQITGLATGTRIERIPLSRWLLAPRTTFLLGRRMVLWHVTSYHGGLQLEHQRLLTVSRLQQDYGRWQWRWQAPLADRLALRLALNTMTSLVEGTTATPLPVGEPEHSLPRQCLIARLPIPGDTAQRGRRAACRGSLRHHAGREAAAHPTEPGGTSTRTPRTRPPDRQRAPPLAHHDGP
jgi:Protein of unknown function (DUF2637)